MDGSIVNLVKRYNKLRFEEIACFSSLLKLEKQAIKLVQAGL
ncbi:MAG: hypothetical protein ACI85I_001395, partial [Arenicella sp.]